MNSLQKWSHTNVELKFSKHPLFIFEITMNKSNSRDETTLSKFTCPRDVFELSQTKNFSINLNSCTS